MSKHLSLDERMDIEKYLTQNKSFKEIGKLVNKNCTTISREIKNHYVTKNTGCVGRKFNNCIYRTTCPNRGKLCTLGNCSKFNVLYSINLLMFVMVVKIKHIVL